MKRFGSFVIVEVLALGLATSVGCQSNARPGLSPNEESPYAGGDGAFGEDPVAPGAYASDRPASKTAVDDGNPYAGGNGAFGEDPVSPGSYHK